MARAFMAAPATIDANGPPAPAGIAEGYRVSEPDHPRNATSRNFGGEPRCARYLCDRRHVENHDGSGGPRLLDVRQRDCFRTAGMRLRQWRPSPTEKDATQPDRSDLRWDFKDVNPTMTAAIAGTGDLNTWLSTLNADRTFDRSMITYAGWKTATISDPAAIAAVLNNPFAAIQMGFGEHDWLSYFVSILTYGLRGNSALPLGYIQNDGSSPTAAPASTATSSITFASSPVLIIWT